MFGAMKTKIPIFLTAGALAVAGLSSCDSGGEASNSEPEKPNEPVKEQVANKTADTLAGKLEILDGDGVKDYTPNREAEAYYVYHSASW